ncbi:MAG: hypothetical protein A2428_07420 [Bdellovibrionales bacterium RIFOXYC1_FULL_54_43]|nr:MAG: hypothetical protein A2428_07420 [Bdellovibrionales bacterium RIFOXYC1_FULL_54_43]OFZ85060.1 MAG: hypothetical protein A2603_07895 [Bdellovibrionales bacterium RIFOXYD1_FULL_55_31]
MFVRGWPFLTVIVTLGCPLLIAVAFGADAIRTDTVYVRTQSGLRIHNRAHIQRVRKLTLALYDRFAGELPGVDRKLLEEFAALHDYEKNNRSILRKGMEPVDRSLWKKYHQILPAGGRQAVDDLNGLDEMVLRDFFKKHRMLTPSGELTELAKTYKDLTEISDFVDRGLSPVAAEEFNKKMKLGSQWLQNPKHVAMAEYLEELDPKAGIRTYDRIVKNSKYEKYLLERSLNRTITSARGDPPSGAALQGAGGSPPKFTVNHSAPRVARDLRSCVARQLLRLSGVRVTPSVNFKLKELRAVTSSLQRLRTGKLFEKMVEQNRRLADSLLRAKGSGSAQVANQFAQAIRRQLPASGHLRAVTPQEVRMLLEQGNLGKGVVLETLENAKLLEGPSLMFIRCRNCGPDIFTRLVRTGRVVTKKPIPLEKIDFIIPEVPIR